LLLKDGLRFVQHRIANMMPNFLCENNLGFTDEFKPDMQTPSVIPKRNLFLAKRAQSRWRRGVEERSTLTARASHIIEARGTLRFPKWEYDCHDFTPRSRSASTQNHIASGMGFNLPTAEYFASNFASFKPASLVSS